MPEILLKSVRTPGGDDLRDVLIRDGRVSSISAASRDTSVRTVDAGGAFILPGLWDEHVHMTQWAYSSNRVNVSACKSSFDAAELLGKYAKIAERDEVIIGVGFPNSLWHTLPTQAMIDASTGAVPALIISQDLHCVWANSAAAQRFAVPTDSTGLITEEVAFDLTRQLALVDDAIVDEWIDAVAASAAARGVVGIVDLEMAYNPNEWVRRASRGFSRLRVDAGVYAADLSRAVAAGLYSGLPLDDSGLIRVGPMKVLIDGSLNSRTAYCFDEYPLGGFGELTVTPEDLDDILAVAKTQQLTPAVHAIGDHATRVALDAFQKAGVAGRIEHAQFVHTDDLPRFSDLGITASVQPVHALDDRDAADSNWAGRTDRAFPLQSLLDAGAHLAFGSDAPVVPIDPWSAMSAATLRSRDDGREPWHPEQSISRADALRASTRGHTAVQVGDQADIVLVEKDPFTASDRDFAHMAVVATLLAGNFTHHDSGLDA